MQKIDIIKLKNITRVMFDYYLPLNVLEALYTINSLLLPIIVDNYLFDYESIINTCLQTPNISTKTFPVLQFCPPHTTNTKTSIRKINLDRLSIKQAQEIIDNNYALFSQLITLIKENDLIEQLK